MALPTNISTGLVTGQFIVGVVDGADADFEPDTIPAKGTITFTPSVPYLPDPTAAPNPVTVLSKPFVALLDDAGYLCTPFPANPKVAGNRGLRLVATDDPDISVTGWTWNVVYALTDAAGASLPIPAHSMALPSGGTVDLTTVIKVPASQGIGLVQAEALAASASAAALAAGASAGEAEAAAEQAAAQATAAAASAADAIDDAAAKYLPIATATSTYLKKTDATATYLPSATAASTYATKAKLAAAADPLAYLNSIDILCSWDTRPAGSETTYPQAVSINETAGEIYVSNQGGTLLRIDTRNLDGSLKSTRSVTTDSGAYTQALPWFYNGTGELCFIVRPGVGADPNTGVFSYAVYNYTTSTLGPRIGIKGHNMADVQGDAYVTMEAGNNDVKNIFIYDWPSVQAGAPVLRTTIPVPGNKVSAAKNQGVAVIGGYIFLLGGAAETNPTITVYDLTGRVVTIHDYKAPDFARALNAVAPGTITNVNSYTYESEGGCRYQGKLVTLDVINNTADIVNSKTYVVIHNVVGGARIPISVRPYTFDTGWVPMTLNAPFVEWSTTATPAVRRIGNMVMFRGSVKGLTTAPASNILFNVPAEYRPMIDRQFTQMSSTGYTTNWQLGANGDLKLLQTRDAAPGASTWYPLPSGSWVND